MTMPSAFMPSASGTTVLFTDKLNFDLTLAQGQILQYDSQKLSNQYQCGVEITEFRFFVYPKPITEAVIASAASVNPFDFGSILSMYCKIGNHFLSPDFVHLRSLAQLLQSNLSFGFQKVLPSLNFATDAYPYASTFFRCVLPDVLYVDPLGAIELRVKSDAIANRPNDMSSFYPNVDVWVAAVGRLTSRPRPRQVPWPYIAEFGPVAGIGVTGSGAATSFAAANNPQFKNPFFNAIRVKKFVASLYAQFRSDVGVVQTNMPFNMGALSALPTAVKMKLRDSQGFNITPGPVPVPLGAFVDQRSGDWTFDRDLEPGEWFELEMYANALDTLPAGLANDPVLFPRLAFLGSHLVDYI